MGRLKRPSFLLCFLLCFLVCDGGRGEGSWRERGGVGAALGEEGGKEEKVYYGCRDSSVHVNEYDHGQSLRD